MHRWRFGLRRAVTRRPYPQVMSKVRAVLLDVFDTVLSVDFDAALDGLAAGSVISRDEWMTGLRLHSHDLMTGAISPEQAFAATLRLAGKAPRDVEQLVERDLLLIREHARVYPDVVPFIDEMHRRKLKVAFVSNCAPNAGPLLKQLGLAARAHHVVLSCDVGSTKPEAAIYRTALDALGVAAVDTVFVDDQNGYCTGAEALGMTAVRIDRYNHTFGAAHSLEDVLALL